MFRAPSALLVALALALGGCVVDTGAPEPGDSRTEESEADVGISSEPEGDTAGSSCGAFGEACCWSGIPYSPYCTERGMGCTSKEWLLPGVCAPCGQLGQPCCEGEERCFPVKERGKWTYECEVVHPACEAGACTDVAAGRSVCR